MLFSAIFRQIQSYGNLDYCIIQIVCPKLECICKIKYYTLLYLTSKQFTYQNPVLIKQDIQYLL